MDLAVWQSTFASAVRELAARTVAYLPNLAAALGLVLVGWMVAWAVRAVVVRVLGAVLGLLGRQPALGRAVERSRLGPGFAALIGRVVYWFVLTLFVAAAVERLELTIAAALVSAFAAFLPRVLVGLVLVFGGIIAGQVAFGAVQRASLAFGLGPRTRGARRVPEMTTGRTQCIPSCHRVVAGGPKVTRGVRTQDSVSGCLREALDQGRVEVRRSRRAPC